MGCEKRMVLLKKELSLRSVRIPFRNSRICSDHHLAFQYEGLYLLDMHE